MGIRLETSELSFTNYTSMIYHELDRDEHTLKGREYIDVDRYKR